MHAQQNHDFLGSIPDSVNLLLRGAACAQPTLTEQYERCMKRPQLGSQVLAAGTGEWTVTEPKASLMDLCCGGACTSGTQTSTILQDGTTSGV
jgi:hypothetical protein